jgi:hypothetical protein
MCDINQENYLFLTITRVSSGSLDEVNLSNNHNYRYIIASTYVQQQINRARVIPQSWKFHKSNKSTTAIVGDFHRNIPDSFHSFGELVSILKSIPPHLHVVLSLRHPTDLCITPMRIKELCDEIVVSLGVDALKRVSIFVEGWEIRRGVVKEVLYEILICSPYMNSTVYSIRIY